MQPYPSAPWLGAGTVGQGQCSPIQKAVLSRCRQRWNSAFHHEDNCLRSFNLCHVGWKAWVVVSAQHRERLEEYLLQSKGHLVSKKDDLCHQFVRHESVAISPSQLRNAGIEFRVIVQGPGEFVVTAPNEYHMVLGIVPSIATSINFQFDDEDFRQNLPHSRVCMDCGHYTMHQDPQNEMRKVDTPFEILSRPHGDKGGGKHGFTPTANIAKRRRVIENVAEDNLRRSQRTQNKPSAGYHAHSIRGGGLPLVMGAAVPDKVPASRPSKIAKASISNNTVEQEASDPSTSLSPPSSPIPSPSPSPSVPSSSPSCQPPTPSQGKDGSTSRLEPPAGEGDQQAPHPEAGPGPSRSIIPVPQSGRILYRNHFSLEALDQAYREESANCFQSSEFVTKAAPPCALVGALATVHNMKNIDQLLSRICSSVGPPGSDTISETTNTLEPVMEFLQKAISLDIQLRDLGAKSDWVRVLRRYADYMLRQEIERLRNSTETALLQRLDLSDKSRNNLSAESKAKFIAGLKEAGMQGTESDV